MFHSLSVGDNGRNLKETIKREAIMSENRCVCCGEIIPEGMQTCRRCVDKYMEQERSAMFTAVAKGNGKELYNKGTLSEITAWADEVMNKEKITEINVRRIEK